jgi:hypothetical protein
MVVSTAFHCTGKILLTKGGGPSLLFAKKGTKIQIRNSATGWITLTWRFGTEKKAK